MIKLFSNSRFDVASTRGAIVAVGETHALGSIRVRKPSSCNPRLCAISRLIQLTQYSRFDQATLLMFGQAIRWSGSTIHISSNNRSNQSDNELIVGKQRLAVAVGMATPLRSTSCSWVKSITKFTSKWNFQKKLVQ